MLVTFIDPVAGLCGLFAVIIVNLLAYSLGYDRVKITRGLYGFNAMLIGLGIGMSYQFSYNLMFVVLILSVLIFFLCVSLDGVFGKYHLPYLSVPFLLVYWAFRLASPYIGGLAASERGLTYLFSLYTFNGFSFLEYTEQWMRQNMDNLTLTYFTSLGQVFFQKAAVSGVVLALGVLIWSRIAFTLTIIGYIAAYFSCMAFSVSLYDPLFYHVNFNYFFIAIAVGAYFYIPSKQSYFWALLLMPVSVFVMLGLTAAFKNTGLPVYSLPLNFMILVFLYALKLRHFRTGGLQDVVVQQCQPEKNLYSFINDNNRFKNKTFINIALPFYGEWHVSQGHEGKITHKDKWKYAWDFVITDSTGSTFKNAGTQLDDFYCYSKAVLTPADGTVIEVIDGIEDNIIGDVNTEFNWGNTIIIKHGEYLYSKLSHLKQGSFKVKAGDFVKSGQIIASCGSSGRSPEPHLHFQLQATAEVDAWTIDYPISYYLRRSNGSIDFLTYVCPGEGEKLSNLETEGLLKNAFNLNPGDVIRFKTEGSKANDLVEWRSVTDIYNYSYLLCIKTGAKAYYKREGKLFYFYHFTGRRSSLLYHFFAAMYKVPLGYSANMKVNDSLPVNTVLNREVMFIQDFFAPFVIFAKASYSLEPQAESANINTTSLELKSTVTSWLLGIKLGVRDYSLQLDRNGFESFRVRKGNKIINALCLNQPD
jgi:urea transporter/murein DD-endopeptidase MepM/ murein hydrolase activator NlpD